MRGSLFVLCVPVMLCVGFSCSHKQEKTHERDVNSNMPSDSSRQSTPKISSEEAVAIAKGDFRRIIGALDDFEITPSEQADEWRVEFRRKNKALEGGITIYAINKETGKILNIKMHQ